MPLSLQQKIALNARIPGRILQYSYALQRSQAIHLDELGLIYLPIPKVASQSIKTSLASKINLSLEGVPHVHVADWNYIGKQEVAKLKEENFTFSFVRNPLDRLVSCFRHKLQPGKDPYFVLWKYGRQVSLQMSFKEFAEFVIRKPDYLSDQHFRSQHTFIFDNHENLADKIFHFESLTDSWNSLAETYALPSLPHLNKTNSKSYLKYYDVALAEKVIKRYQKDTELLGYSDSTEADLELLASAN